MAVISAVGGSEDVEDRIKNCRLSAKPHTPVASFARTLRVCVPAAKACVKLGVISKLVCPKVNDKGVALPTPGSTSKKYSALVILGWPANGRAVMT